MEFFPEMFGTLRPYRTHGPALNFWEHKLCILGRPSHMLIGSFECVDHTFETP